MILRIKNVLDSSGLAELRAIIDAGSWVDGNETSGHQSRLAKRNHQLAQGSEAAQVAVATTATAGAAEAAQAEPDSGPIRRMLNS